MIKNFLLKKLVKLNIIDLHSFGIAFASIINIRNIITIILTLNSLYYVYFNKEK